MRFALALILAGAFAASSFAQVSAKAEAHIQAKPKPAAAPCQAGGCPAGYARMPVAGGPVRYAFETIEPPLATVAIGTFRGIVHVPFAFFARLKETALHIVPHRNVSRSRAVTRTR